MVSEESEESYVHKANPIFYGKLFLRCKVIDLFTQLSMNAYDCMIEKAEIRAW